MLIKLASLVIFLAFPFFIYAEEIDLNNYEKSIYSRHGEDGVLAKIMEVLNPFPLFFLELGTIDKSIGSNSQLFRMQGWDSLTMNRYYESRNHKIFKEYVTAENVINLLGKHKEQHGFYLLFIDMSYNDFYIWKSLNEKYQATVVVIKYNATHAPSEDKVVKYYPYYCGDGTDYFGASILALYNFGRSAGYSLVYADQSGTNLFFIKDEVLQEKNLQFKNMNDVEKIYRSPMYGSGLNARYLKDMKDRLYLSSSEILNSD
jgi:hypothetical protein